MYTCWLSDQKWFAFRPRWPKFGPLVATKWLQMVVHHYLEKYPRNPIQTWCVHFLWECSELICFWATLAKFWPSSGHKITEIVVSHQYLKKYHHMEYWLLELFQTWFSHWVEGSSQIGQIGPNLAPLVTTSVLTFPLNRPHAGTCILWCLAFTIYIITIFPQPKSAYYVKTTT